MLDMSNEPIDLDMDKRYIRDVKSQMEIVRRSENSYVIVLAVNKEPHNNSIKKIPSRRGIPIGGYVYDASNDCYLIKCMGFAVLGYVPISFKLQMAGVGSWAVDLPVPESILTRHLTAAQKSELRKFMGSFRSEECNFEYVQMLGPS